MYINLTERHITFFFLDIGLSTKLHSKHRAAMCNSSGPGPVYELRSILYIIDGDRKAVYMLALCRHRYSLTQIKSIRERRIK